MRPWLSIPLLVIMLLLLHYGFTAESAAAVFIAGGIHRLLHSRVRGRRGVIVKIKLPHACLVVFTIRGVRSRCQGEMAKHP